MSYWRLSRAIAEGSAPDLVPKWTVDTLRAVADGGSPLRATSHPLGFTCLPVVRDGLYGICVHLWDPSLTRGKLTTSTIHAHSWQLSSYVLYGEVTNERILIGEANSVPEHLSNERTYRLLEVHSHGDIDELWPTAQLVRCTNRSAQHYVAGNSYSMPAGAFHTTTLKSNAEAATVALGHMVPGAANLSLANPDVGPHWITRRRLNHQDTVLAARMIIERLSLR